MKRFLISFIAVAMLVGLGLTIGCQRAVEPVIDVAEPPPAEVPPEDLAALVEGNNQFALDLYKKLAETEKGNIFFSPYSISSALAMTYAGARGQTAEEMAKVLGIAKLGDKVHPAHASLAYKLKSAGGKDKPEFHIANALWGQQRFPFLDEFMQLNQKNYGADMNLVDFANNKEAARQQINEWVRSNTQDRIKELVHEEDLYPNTRLVLTNTIYFKGSWQIPFPEVATTEADFESAPGKVAKVQMMKWMDEFRYYQATDYSIVELPYRGDRIAMVVLLPNKRCGLADVERTLTDRSLRENIAKMQLQHVTVSLPKFKTKHRSSLKEPLEELGMPTAFTLNANFSGINTGGGLYIYKVIHEGAIDVDEVGTVATAATAVFMKVSAPNSVPFRADQPFLYLIVDRQTSGILFVGRFANIASKSLMKFNPQLRIQHSRLRGNSV